MVVVVRRIRRVVLLLVVVIRLVVFLVARIIATFVTTVPIAFPAAATMTKFTMFFIIVLVVDVDLVLNTIFKVDVAGIAEIKAFRGSIGHARVSVLL
jgi:hypothetical protein